MKRVQLNNQIYNRGIVLVEKDIGVALFCFYAFVSSLANDTVLPIIVIIPFFRVFCCVYFEKKISPCRIDDKVDAGLYDVFRILFALFT